ncbi:serine acetyltransferase [Spirosoma horti]
MYIFQDWKRNHNSLKGRIVLPLFRAASSARQNKLIFFILLPYLILYRFLVEWVLGIELPYKTKINRGLVIYHGQSLVVNDGTVIGSNCTLRHCTTIGNKQNSDGSFSKCPIIGNNVDIGAHVCLIGPITIGDNVVIGAGSVVVKDVPSNSVVVGNPAKIIRKI